MGLPTLDIHTASGIGGVARDGALDSLASEKAVEAEIEQAIRRTSSLHGCDLHGFTLVSIGVAGDLHDCAIADALGISRVLIAPNRNALAELGMRVAPPIADACRSVVHLAAALDNERLIAEFGSVNGETIDEISYEQTDRVEVYADVRFRGQAQALTVKVDQPTLEHIAERFHQAYQKRNDGIPQDGTVEIVTVRVRRIGRPAAAASLPLMDAAATSYIPPGWKMAAPPAGIVILTR